MPDAGPDPTPATPATSESPEAGSSGTPGAGTSGSPGNLGSPGSLGTPDSLGNPANLGTSGSLGNPANLENPVSLGTSGTPDNLGNRANLGNPGSLGNPANLENLGTSGTPDNLGNRANLGTPGSLGSSRDRGNPRPLADGSSPDGLRGQLRDERPALRRCVAGDLDEFATSYWGTRALLSHGPDLPAPYDDLFSLEAVDELLSRRGLRTPFLRIAKNGAVVGDSQFTGPAGVGAEIADQVQDDKVAALFASGHTVVLQALHRTWPALVDFSTQLSADSGHPVQINAYITPAESQGFSAHYDVHDVFVLQVAGEKHWTVHEPVHVDPLRNQPWTDHAQAVAAAARDNAPVIDEVLRPGDALYVPRGFLHSAKALGGVSAHLTVGMHTLTRYLLVQELAALAANEPALRTALPLGFDPGDPDQLAEILPAVAELFAQQIRSAIPDALAARLRRRTWSSNRPAPLPPLAHAASIASLSIGTTVRLRPGLRCRVIPGDPVVLQLPDRTVTFPPSTQPALTELTSGTDCKVGTLPALPSPDQLVLVRRLLKEAVLVATTN